MKRQKVIFPKWQKLPRKQKKLQKKRILNCKCHKLDFNGFVNDLIDIQRSFNRDKILLDYVMGNNVVLPFLKDDYEIDHFFDTMEHGVSKLQLDFDRDLKLLTDTSLLKIESTEYTKEMLECWLDKITPRIDRLVALKLWKKQNIEK